MAFLSFSHFWSLLKSHFAHKGMIKPDFTSTASEVAKDMRLAKAVSRIWSVSGWAIVGLHARAPTPPGYVTLGDAWRTVAKHGEEWGIELTENDLHLQEAIATRLGVMLAAKKAEFFGYELPSGRMWHIPDEAWLLSASLIWKFGFHFVGRPRSQMSIACAGKPITVMCRGSEPIRCLAFLTERDLACAMGATKPPLLPEANLLVFNTDFWPDGVSAPLTRVGRPSDREYYISDTRKRINTGEAVNIDDEALYQLNRVKALPDAKAVQLGTIRKNLRIEFDKKILPSKKR